MKTNKKHITENKISEIVGDVLNEFKNKQGKENINEGNAYKVDFNKLGQPQGQGYAGAAGGNYFDKATARKAMENGTYGHSGWLHMGSLIQDLQELGYTQEQIQQGIKNGAIRITDTNGNNYGARRNNRKYARLMTKAGGVLGTGAATADTQHHLVKDPVTSPAPLPEPSNTGNTEVQTRTVYFQSDKIRQVQELLNNKFQAGLVVDGKCGDKTATAMLNALNQMGNQQTVVPPVAEPVKRDTSNEIPKVNTNITGTAQASNQSEMPSHLPSQPLKESRELDNVFDMMNRMNNVEF